MQYPHINVPIFKTEQEYMLTNIWIKHSILYFLLSSVISHLLVDLSLYSSVLLSSHVGILPSSFIFSGFHL